KPTLVVSCGSRWEHQAMSMSNKLPSAGLAVVHFAIRPKLLSGLAILAVLGSVSPGHGDEQGFLYYNGTYAPISFPGSPYTNPFAINNTGQIVGYYLGGGPYQNGLVYSNGSYTAFDVPGSNSTIPSGINDAGQIVGNFGPGVQSFLYSGGGFS